MRDASRSSSDTAGQTTAKWGRQKRLEFIEFRLYWQGRINRSDLRAHFGISIPQASLDLRRYQELCPHSVEYDRSGKFYHPTAGFRTRSPKAGLDFFHVLGNGTL